MISPNVSAPVPPAGHKGIASHLYVQVLVAIVLGALLGHFWPTYGEAMKPLGDGFIKLVEMIVAPVIFLTIVTGMPQPDQFHRQCRRDDLASCDR